MELKSDYSSDRPSSYNTSHTANSDHCDRLEGEGEGGREGEGGFISLITILVLPANNL